MVYAAKLSENISGFSEGHRIEVLLRQYGLPVSFDFDSSRALQYMWTDKKRAGDKINYVLLEQIGKAIIKPLSIVEIQAAAI